MDDMYDGVTAGTAARARHGASDCGVRAIAIGRCLPHEGSEGEYARFVARW
jgi:hypothetical protein